MNILVLALYIKLYMHIKVVILLFQKVIIQFPVKLCNFAVRQNYLLIHKISKDNVIDSHRAVIKHDFDWKNFEILD